MKFIDKIVAKFTIKTPSNIENEMDYESNN